MLFEKLIGFVHGKSKGANRASRGVELITLPLDDDEERWFDEYLGEGNGRSLPGAVDSLTMRSIATGCPATVLQNSRFNNEQTIDGISWDNIQRSLQT